MQDINWDETVRLVGRLNLSALGHTSARHRIDDINQECLAEIVRSADKFRESVAAWVTFVSRICERVRIDEYRRCSAKKRNKKQEQPIINADIAARKIEEKISLPPDFLKPLRPVERNIVHLAYWRGFTLAQIAAETGKPLGTVKSILSRALDVLREKRTLESVI